VPRNPTFNHGKPTMMNPGFRLTLLCGTLALAALVGCNKKPDAPMPDTSTSTSTPPPMSAPASSEMPASAASAASQ
jgi:hypothetical protein